jgi:hypothetical protein
MSVLDITEGCYSPGCGVICSGRSVPAFHIFRSCIFLLYILYFNIMKVVTVQKGPLRFLLYLSLLGCFIGMPGDGPSTSRNM